MMEHRQSKNEQLPWDLPDPFTIDVEVTEEEIDGLGHTNNAVYLSWCDRVAWAHTEAVGLGLDDWQRLGRAMAMYGSELQLVAPSFRGERVRVGNWVVFCDGRLRASRRYQIIRLDDRVTLARVFSRFVCIDLESGRPRRMPVVFGERYHVEPTVADAMATTEWPFMLRNTGGGGT